MAEDRRYKVEVWSLDEFFGMLMTFPQSQQERIPEFMAAHLTVRPKVMIPGLLKELKGRWSGVYQLECGGPRRLLYEVDDNELKVRIIYLGQHPHWENRRRMDAGR